MSLFLTAIVAGIAVGAIYAIVGIGYTVVFNATRVFNLAQGDLVMVGIMLSYYILVVLKWSQLAAFVLVVIAVVLISMFEERTVVRMFLKKQGNATFGWFIATLGFSYIDVGRQAGKIVVRVLKGEKPGNIAVENAQTTDLYVNPNSAKKMGVTIPQTLVSQAKKVFE